ncbi:hypothetical protein BH11ACT8_BH11ACT8_16760 [soil metagenome]
MGMTSFTMSTTSPLGYDETVAAVRRELAEVGFGVLTEIDIKATLKTKLDVDVPSQVILGACRPDLAHQAMTAAPSIAALLPCNVVVRETPDGTLVEAVDPDKMMAVAGDDDAAAGALHVVATDARQRLCVMLDAVAALAAPTEAGAR